MDIQKKVLRAFSVEEVEILRDKFNTICESRIEKLNFLNRIGEISSFSEMKFIFESMSPSLFSTKDGRNCIKSFLKTINENKSLQTAYLLNENIIHCDYEGDKKSFLLESLNMVNNVSQKQFIEGVSKLQKNLMEGVNVLTDEDIANINKAINEVNLNKTMGEVLDSLTFHPKRMSNLLEFNQYVDSLVPFMEEIVKAKKNVQAIGESAEDILNRINEEESKENLELFKTLLEAEDKNKVFEEYKDSCMRTIKKAIRENKNDESVANKLTSILEKVEKKEYNIASYGADIASFMELENVVNE